MIPIATPDANPAFEYFGILRRRWWILAGMAAVAATLTWWSQRNDLPQYTAEVLIELRAEQPLLEPPWRGEQVGTDFGTQAEILQSRAVLMPVVDSLGLQLALLTQHAARSDIVGGLEVERDPRNAPYVLRKTSDGLALFDRAQDRLVVREQNGRVSGGGFTLTVAPNIDAVGDDIEFRLQDKEAALERLTRRVKVEQAKGPYLIRIQFTDPDPRFAATVANTTAKFFQEYKAKVAREQAGRRRTAILSQLVELADSVKAAQQVLLNYQRQSQMLDPNVEGNALMAARLQAENDLRSFRFDEGRLASLVSGLNSVGQDSESLAELMVLGRDLVPLGATLHTRLQSLESERTTLTASRFGATASNPRVETVDSLIAATREQMRLASTQALDMVRVQIQSSETRLSEIQADIGALPARSAEVSRLQQQVDGVQSIFDGLVQQYHQTEIAESVETGDIHIVDPAHEPLWPDPSRHSLNLMVALLTGVILGGLAAVLIDSLDMRIHGTRDARVVPGLDVIGTIPRIASNRNRSESALIAREAFRALRTNLSFSASRFPVVVAVTSPAPSDGKSTVAANLSLAFADQLTRVLLIDADLRRPKLHRLSNIAAVPGLTDILSDKANMNDAIRCVPLKADGSLYVLPSGHVTENPTRFLTDPRFPKLFAQLRTEFDVVVIDTPPLLAVTDSLPVARVADATILVARANQTHVGSLLDAVEQLRTANISLLGVLLNDLPAGSTPYYRYRKYYMAAERDRRARRQTGSAPIAFDLPDIA